MPIGNQEIWDKGIGAGATNVVFGQQPQQTNFNPGALGADPNAQQQQQPVTDPQQNSNARVDAIRANAPSGASENIQWYDGSQMYISASEQAKKEGLVAGTDAYNQRVNQLMHSAVRSDMSTEQPNLSGVKSNPNNPKLKTGSGKLMSG